MSEGEIDPFGMRLSMWSSTFLLSGMPNNVNVRYITQ